MINLAGENANFGIFLTIDVYFFFLYYLLLKFSVYFAGNTFNISREVLNLLKYASAHMRVIVEKRWRE